ncbi:hypothetical protein SAMN06265182_0387 [Persephonella hydrogeniphila]|uniref:Uncharacterized protein n=1 Tax=Persephonella hydrogeniphila TaxID=198703 RepID=A0A285N1W1_9AQUI|nr:hypothetical protein SAMN06265182_0387 [Persephonella hydrogeniphila]
MDPGVWFPAIIIGMVVLAVLAFGLIMYLDKGE